MKLLKASASILAECVAIAAVFTFLIYLANNAVSASDLRKAFFEVFFFAFAIVSLAIPVFRHIHPYVFERRPLVQWTIFVTTLCLVCVAGCIIASLVVLWTRFERDAGFSAILTGSLKASVPIALLVGVTQAILVIQRDRLQAANERMAKLVTEARLAALEARVHPHFLFNTLNSISSLISSDPPRAERLIERLAALLRFSLDVPGGLISVHDEIKIVQDYLEIEQARLGGRLRYSLDISPDLSGARVPPLSIQTLVENSIKHAIAPDRQGGEVHVRAVQQGSVLHIEVSDTGGRFALDAFPAGHGLDNLRNRLDALFGNEATLQLYRADSLTIGRLIIPI